MQCSFFKKVNSGKMHLMQVLTTMLVNGSETFSHTIHLQSSILTNEDVKMSEITTVGSMRRKKNDFKKSIIFMFMFVKSWTNKNEKKNKNNTPF